MLAALHTRSHNIFQSANSVSENCTCPEKCSTGLGLFFNRANVATVCSKCHCEVVSKFFKGCYECRFIACPQCSPLPKTITEEDFQLAQAATESVLTRNAEISRGGSFPSANAATKAQPVSFSAPNVRKHTSSDKDALKHAWKSQAFNGRIIRMPKDGHCLFHAIGRACRKPFLEVRRLCVAYMTANPERYIEKVIGRSWQQYLIDMSKESRVVDSKSYGDDLSICALSCIFRRPILVIHKSVLNVLERNPCESTAKPIYLLYDSNMMHYDLVQ